MQVQRHLFLCIALSVGAVGVSGGSEPESSRNEREQRQRLLALAKQDPERFARLTKDLKAFQTLSPEGQESIRDLDRALHEKDPETQARLHRALERYAGWLQRLPEAERKRVDAAGDHQERLAVVKEIRERQWLSRLPRAQREEIDRLDGQPKRERIAELRRLEKKTRDDWERAVHQLNEAPKGTPPVRTADLPPEVQRFIRNQLLPVLTEDEKTRLRNAEGQANYSKVLVELIRKHKLQKKGQILRLLGE